MVSRWNLWVWLQCIGVVVVRRYIDILTIIINFPIPLVLAIFGSSIPSSLVIFKMFLNKKAKWRFLLRAARTLRGQRCSIY